MARGLSFYFLLATATFAPAQSVWVNTVDGNWNTAANWSGTPPVAGGSVTATLSFGGTTNYTTTNNLAGVFQVNALTFNNTGSGTTVTLSGNEIRLTGSSPTFVFNGSGNSVINTPFSIVDGTGTNPTLSGTGTGALTISTLSGSGNADRTLILNQSGGALITINTLAISNNASVRLFTLTLTTNATVGAITNGASTVGSFTKANGGTLNLTAASTYTGATRINNGSIVLQFPNALPTATTLALGNGANSGILNLNGFSQQIAGLSLNGTGTANRIVSNNTTMSILTVSSNTVASTYAGLIGQTVANSNLGLTKDGLATLTLTNPASLYRGPTTLNGGILSVASLANIGAASAIGAGNTSNNSGSLIFDGGTLQYTGADAVIDRGFTINANGGTLDLPASVTLSLGGDLLGSGTLTKTNTTGTLIVTANASHTGGTLLLGGTLAIGNAGTTGSLAGNVANSGTLAFNRSDTVTYTGNITGSGGLAQNGSGTLVLNGLGNTFSGTTTINAGTLQIGDGGANGSLTSSVNFGNGAALTVNSAAAITLPGNLSGSGVFTQLGSGTTTLLGTNALATVAIAGGVLRVQPDSLGAASSITVNDGAGIAVFNAGTTSVTASNLTLGTTTGAAVRFELNGNPSSAPLAVNNLNVNGVATIAVANGAIPLSIGTVPLLTYGSGTLGALALGSVPSRVVANLNTSTPGQVNLTITAIDTPVRWW